MTETVHEQRKKNGIGRLLQIAGEKKGLLTASSVLALIGELLSLVPFVVMYLVAVALLEPPIDSDYVWNLIMWAIIAFIARAILRYVSNILSHISAYNILYGLRTKLARHLGTLPMGFFSKKSTGSIKKVMSEDIERVELFIAHHIPDMVSVFVLPVVTLAYLATVSWPLTIMAMVPIPIAFLLWFRSFAGNKQDMEQKMIGYHNAMEDMNGTIVEYVYGMPVVKAFNQTVFSFERFRNSVYRFRDYCNEWNEQFIHTWAGFNVMMGTGIMFILPLGIWLLDGGSITIPVLMLFLILGVGVTRPLYKAVTIFSSYQMIRGGVQKIDAILDEPPIPEPSSPTVPDDHSVEFDGVSFSYGTVEVLHNISFRSEKGTVTALVGPSGAGKSTIAQLIPRLWDVQHGSIKVGGVDIKDIPIEKLMNMIAFVFQDSFIFSDTVRENIRMGMDVTDEDIVKAARAAQVHDVITDLPNGYDTVIGEGGHNLSGGEKQRISIARAVLKDAPIIILDEATAFSDPDNECRIQEALGRLIRNKTAIVVAHRLSTIMESDQIIVVDEGRIVEKGRHEELLNEKELYSRMWESHVSAQTWTVM